MSSQKSSPAAPVARPAEALAPKRARGRLRVDAILDAAAPIFAERGFEAATMSEIAAGSATAIGSLYRFFPTKEALADAVLRRHVADIAARLDAIEAQARAMPTSGIADALCDLMLDRRRDRAAAVALLDLHADAADRRSSLREHVRGGIARILRAADPGIDASRAAVLASVLLQLLKTTRVLAADEDPAPRLAELRIAICLYLGHCLAGR